jgi:hypothetical protein
MSKRLKGWRSNLFNSISTPESALHRGRGVFGSSSTNKKPGFWSLIMDVRYQFIPSSKRNAGARENPGSKVLKKISVCHLIFFNVPAKKEC